MTTRFDLLTLCLLAAAPAFGQALPAPGPGAPSTKAALTEGSHPALPVSPGFADARAQKALEAYKLPAQTFPIKLGPAKQDKRYTEREVSFPSAVTTRWPTITGTYFAPKKATRKTPVPGVVVVHHLGGGFQAEEMLARHLANNGLAAYTISLPNYGKRREKGTRQGFLRTEPLTALKGFQQAVQDVIRAGDFLRSRPEVIHSRVGLVGISLGAFVSSVARGVDPRFRRTVLILGGGNLTSMIEEIPQASKVLKKVTGGGSIDALKAMIKPFITPVDPVTFARRVLPQDVLMFNALKDEIVPVSSAKALWRALGKPEIHWYDTDHLGLTAHLLEVIGKTTKHLKGRSAI